VLLVLSQMQPNGLRGGKLLLELHNMSNQDERDRLSSEHPGEVDLFTDNRLTGRVEFTRCMFLHSQLCK